MREECSQWGKHPHEVEPPHESDGWMEIDLRTQGLEIREDVPVCWACLNDVVPDSRITAWLFRNSHEEVPGYYRWIKAQGDRQP